MDFISISRRLVIELDGKYHESITEDDANRTYYLMEKGYRVVRFGNEEVLNGLGKVCQRLLLELKRAGIPLPPGEGGVPSGSEGAG